MKEVMKKLRKLAFLLIFIGGAVLFFNQNSAANVYADDYEDTYGKDPYTLEIGKPEKGKEYHLENAGLERVFKNTIDILVSEGKIKSVAVDSYGASIAFTYEFTQNDETNDRIKIIKKSETNIVWIYNDGFDYSITDSPYGYDSDGDSVKDCIRFTISSAEAQRHYDLKNLPYFKELIIKPRVCDVTIDPNGGEFISGSSAPATISAPVGISLSKLANMNNGVLSSEDDYGMEGPYAGYYRNTLVGFAYSSNASEPAAELTGEYVFENDTTIYAVWKKTQLRVDMYPNGGGTFNGDRDRTCIWVDIGSTFEQLIENHPDMFNNENYGFKEYDFGDDGYDFLGLSFSSSATTPDPSITGSYVFDEPKEIYAVWKKYYIVSFYDRDKEPVVQKLYSGDKPSKLPDPKADGCEFMGWYTNKPGIYFRDYYYPNDSYVELFDFNKPIDQGYIVYAGWKIKITLKGYNNRKLSWDKYLRFSGTSDVYLYNKSEFYDEEFWTLPDGYFFDGWYRDSEYKELVFPTNPYTDFYGSDDYYVDYPNKSTTYYAKIVKKLDSDIQYTIDSPDCGTVVTSAGEYTATQYCDYSGIIQNNTPVIKGIDTSQYNVDAVLWLSKPFEFKRSSFMVTPGENKLYSGKMNGDTEYNAVVVISPQNGYGFGDTMYAVNSDTGDVVAVDVETPDRAYIPVSVKTHHHWNDGEITKQPTCKISGIKTFTCSGCNGTKTENVDMIAHKWGKGVVVREATSEKTGLISYTCTMCGDAKYEETPKLTASDLSKKESEAVDQMNKEIDYLPDADDVTLENAEKIKELIKTYDNMSEKQKEVIPGDKIKKLMQAYNRITILELEAADPDSEMNTDKAVNVLSDAGDLKNSTFAELQLKAKAKKNSITLTWNKVSEAKGYLVYGNLCGKNNKMIKIKATTDTKLKLDKINGKAIESGKYYKFIVVAYKDTQKFKHNVALSKSLHVATPGGKYTNVKKLNIKKTKVSIKKGKKYTIKAKFTKENKKLEAKRHTGLNGIRFESSDPSIAKVNNKGVVTGKKKGKATIYVYAQNGVYKKVKVTVK